LKRGRLRTVKDTLVVKLTYRFSGRDFRLTDVSGNVITDIA
jgi:hypothetical protein